MPRLEPPFGKTLTTADALSGGPCRAGVGHQSSEVPDPALRGKLCTGGGVETNLTTDLTEDPLVSLRNLRTLRGESIRPAAE